MSRRRVYDEPVLQLAEDLRDGGRPDLHRRLLEDLNDSPLTEDHVPNVQTRLAEILADRRVAQRDETRVQHLIDVGDNLFHDIGRCGVVHMTWLRRSADEPGPVRRARPITGEHEGVYLGHWGGEESYEASPEFDSLTPALEWARARATRVIVRPWWDAGVEYWAGDPPCPDQYPQLEIAERLHDI